MRNKHIAFVLFVVLLLVSCQTKFKDVAAPIKKTDDFSSIVSFTATALVELRDKSIAEGGLSQEDVARALALDELMDAIDLYGANLLIIDSKELRSKWKALYNQARALGWIPEVAK